MENDQKQRKNIRMKEIHLAYTKIASFNLKGGLWKACNKELLVKDMIKQKIDIAFDLRKIL